MPRHIHPEPFILRPPDDLARPRPELRWMGQMLSNKYAGKQVVTDQDLQAMGRALWNALAPDAQAAFDAARAASGAAILSIIVESGAADVQALPWETLHHPAHGFIGKNAAFTLARRLGAAAPAAPPLDKGRCACCSLPPCPTTLTPSGLTPNMAA
jgi:hypothetical protein